MIPRRHATAFLRFAVGIKGSDERATHFDVVTIGGGFAGPCTAVLEAGTDASYLMLTVLGGRPRRVRARLDPSTRERGTRAGESPRCQARSQAEHQNREAIRRHDCRRRAAARHHPQLHRVAQHDFPTDSATGQPFRRRSDIRSRDESCLALRRLKPFCRRGFPH
jgi:hypothetical protein